MVTQMVEFGDEQALQSLPRGYKVEWVKDLEAKVECWRLLTTGCETKEKNYRGERIITADIKIDVAIAII